MVRKISGENDAKQGVKYPGFVGGWNGEFLFLMFLIKDKGFYVLVGICEKNHVFITETESAGWYNLF